MRVYVFEGQLSSRHILCRGNAKISALNKCRDRPCVWFGTMTIAKMEETLP